jgi:carboxymethylenebutenolidase
MIETIPLTSAHDGFVFSAYSARPPGVSQGGVVIAQEIFGLTDHIADMCTAFAAAGYAAVAPSLYDRIEPNFHAGRDPLGILKGRRAAEATAWDDVVGDIQAAIDSLPQPCYVAGFCWGGSATWVAAARCDGPKAASCFYGRLIVNLLDDKPRVPVMLHYGARDASIPPDDVERVRLAAPDSPLYLYDAGHGFCRAGSSDFDAPSCELALARTLDWFARWR